MNDKIEYQATIEDMTAVTYRVTESVGAVRRAKRNALILFPFVVGFFLLPPSRSLLDGLVVGSIVGALATAAQFFTCESSIRKSIRKMMVEQYGGEGPFPAAYELSDGGLIYRIAALEMRFSWAGMDGAARDGDYLVVDIGRPKNACMIPLRAFRDPAQAAAWRDFIAAKISPKTAA